MSKYKFYFSGEWHHVEGDNLKVTETGVTIITLRGTGKASVPAGVLVEIADKDEE